MVRSPLVLSALMVASALTAQVSAPMEPVAKGSLATVKVSKTMATASISQTLGARPIWSLVGVKEFPGFLVGHEAIYLHEEKTIKRLELADAAITWSLPTEARPVREVGGRLYLFSEDFQLFCLDAATGRQQWKVKLTNEGNASFFQGNLNVIQNALKGPLQVGDRLLLGTFGGSLFKGTTGKLYALEAATGKVIWSFEAEDGIENLPIVEGGVVFCGGKAACYAVDLATGKQLWKAPVRSDNQWSFQVTGDAVVVSAGRYGSQGAMFGGTLYAFNKGNGSQKWKYDIGGPSPMRLVEGQAMGLEWGMMGGSKVTSIRLADGKKAWEFKEKSAANPVLHKGRLVHVSKDEKVFVLDALSGKALGSFKAAADCGFSAFSPWVRFADPAVLMDRVWVASWDKRTWETVLQAVNLEQGTADGEMRIKGELQMLFKGDRFSLLLVKQKDDSMALQVLGT